MNLAMILAIPDRVVMVIGDEKIAVLDAALTGTELPITRLLAHDGTRITKERI
jgi:6-phosphogluconolactonase/glucosamine-6-phosphate isomerase/deaminase